MTQHERLDGSCSTSLAKWFDWQGSLASLKTSPIFAKFISVKLGPCFDKALLTSWYRSGDHLDRVNAEDAHSILIVSMKVGRVMSNARLRIHPDNDPEETAQLWHIRILAEVTSY